MNGLVIAKPPWFPSVTGAPGCALVRASKLVRSVRKSAYVQATRRHAYIRLDDTGQNACGRTGPVFVFLPGTEMLDHLHPTSQLR